MGEGRGGGWGPEGPHLGHIDQAKSRIHAGGDWGGVRDLL